MPTRIEPLDILLAHPLQVACMHEYLFQSSIIE